MENIITLLSISVMCAAISYLLAESKNRPRVQWAVMGAAFGPVTVLVLLIWPRSTSGEQEA